jgi:hypothetical protein
MINNRTIQIFTDFPNNRSITKMLNWFLLQFYVTQLQLRNFTDTIIYYYYFYISLLHINLFL